MAYNPQSRPQPVFNINPNQVREARPQPVFNINPNQSREPRPQPAFNINPNQSREPRPQPLLNLNANQNRGDVNPNQAREMRPQPMLNINQNREPRPQPLLNLNSNHARESRPQPVFNIDPTQLQNVFSQAHFNPNQAQYDPRQLANFNVNHMNFSNTNQVNSSANHAVFNTNQAHASSYQAHSHVNVPNAGNYNPGHGNKTMSSHSSGGNFSTGNNKLPVPNHGGFSSGNLKMNMNEPLSSVIYNYLAPDDQQRIILNQSLQHFKQDPSVDHVDRIMNNIVRNETEPAPPKKKAKHRPEKWEQNMTKVINDVARAGHFYVSNPNPQIASQASEGAEGATEGNAESELPPRKGGCFMCSKCAKPFSETSLLMEHIRECTVVGYTCGTCGKNFKFKNSMVTHRKTFHEGVRYKCTKCPKIFMAQSKLNIHMKNHEGVFYTCEHCPKTFCSKYSLKEHSRRHDGKKYVCSEEGCDKEFYVERYFRDHLKTHDGNRERFNCEKCEKSFSLEKNLKTHIRNKHGPRKQTKNLKIYAATMKEILENPDKAKEILEARRRKLRRKPTKKKRSVKKKIKKNGVKGKKDGVKGKGKGSKLDKSDKPRRKKKKKDLGAGAAIEGDNQDGTGVSREGDVKPELGEDGEIKKKKKKRRAKPKNRSKYYYVMGKDGMLIRKMKKAVKKVRRQIFRCHCGLIFFQEHQYKQHNEAHKRERYFCAHCNKLYHVRYYLIEHLKTHDASYNFYCFSCRKYFKSEEGHRKWHESKSFSCKLCPRSYTSRVFLLQHVKQIHGFENYPTKQSKTPQSIKSEQNPKSDVASTESKDTVGMGDHFLALPTATESVPESNIDTAVAPEVCIKREPAIEPSNTHEPNDNSLDSSPEPIEGDSSSIKMEPPIRPEALTKKTVETEDGLSNNMETETSTDIINTQEDGNMEPLARPTESDRTRNLTDFGSKSTSNHNHTETDVSGNIGPDSGYTHNMEVSNVEASASNFEGNNQRHDEHTSDNSETNDTTHTAGFTPTAMEPPPDNIGPDFSYMNYLNLMCKTPDVGNFHNT